MLFQVLGTLMLQEREIRNNDKFYNMSIFEGAPKRDFDEHGRAHRRRFSRNQILTVLGISDVTIIQVAQSINVLDNQTGRLNSLKLFFFKSPANMHQHSGLFPECAIGGLAARPLEASKSVLLDRFWRCRPIPIPDKLLFLPKAVKQPFILLPITSVSEISGKVTLDNVERVWIGGSREQAPVEIRAGANKLEAPIEWKVLELKSTKGLSLLHTATKYWLSFAVGCLSVAFALYYKKEISALKAELKLRIALGQDKGFVAMWLTTCLMTQVIFILILSFLVVGVLSCAFFPHLHEIISLTVIFQFFSMAAIILSLTAIYLSYLVAKYYFNDPS